MSLKDALRQQGMSFSMPCGGNGTCGRCRVRFLSEAPEASADDRRFFSQRELREGWRLGCRTHICGACQLVMADPQEWEEKTISFSGEKQTDIFARAAGRFGVGIDLGTTTIAAALLDLSAGTVRKTYTCQNHQSSYGADVLTRIQQANEGRQEELKHLVQRDLEKAVEVLLEDSDMSVENETAPENIETVIAGNTTMLHLLLGYSCRTLGEAPFLPVTLSPLRFRKRWNKTAFDVSILPGISAFVGADVVSGIYATKMLEQQRPILLLDLGTNGEMALWTGNRLYVTSAAAGPAFEGGNITNGMPGVSGAICGVVTERGQIRVSTIDDQTPRGICGTGLISAVVALRELGMIDTSGRLEDPYADEGFPLWRMNQRVEIRLYQEDIRQLQMAKSAIRTGMELLMRQAGIRVGELYKIYLAGGMGYSLIPEDAVKIGLIPREALTCCEAVGNTSLKGTLLYLQSAQDHTGESMTEKIAAAAQPISLADHPEFEELYLKYMEFPQILIDNF